jgi:hypothetical protein
MNVPNIPTVSTRLGIRDRAGRIRVRWGIGRGRYRVDPGLYRVGSPTPESPVMVTANFKLTFDMLRSNLAGIDTWILVLDTNGVNVWCAAGKGTFGTDELVRRVQETGLRNVISHRKLILPQLGAPGVAAHEVKNICGFKVVYGPVRASDIKAFLAFGMQASDEMRRVTFAIGERAELVGVELAAVLKWVIPLLLLALLIDGSASILEKTTSVLKKGAPLLAGVSLKGGVLGAAVVGATIAVLQDGQSATGMAEVFLFGTAIASFLAMQFTGATTFTSPSGVEWEMRRALIFQIGAAVLATVICIAAMVAN